MKSTLLVGLFIMQLTRLFGALDLEHLEKDGTAFHRVLAQKIKARLDENPAALKTTLERLRHLVLSDRVGFYFNVSADQRNGEVILSGETERREFRDITLGVFQQLGFTSIVNQVEIVPNLQADALPFGITTQAQVLTWSQPDLTGMQMDEALLGEPIYILKELPNVYLIKTLTGYWGYAAKAGFRRISKQQFILELNGPKAMLLKDHAAVGQVAPSGARLRIKEWGAGTNCALTLPDGQVLRVPKTICQRAQREPQIETLLAFVQSYLDAPYNLGGKNRVTGIDCSGLVQMSYRLLGFNLPRDAKQQYLGGHLILPCVKEALLPGDAIFFMDESGQVDHVALYIGDHKIIHASGNRVKRQSLDPASPDYLKRFDHDFIGAKRFWW